MTSLQTTRAGFTLVELSIVLVIIGLIIGGVLSGQQIMQNARITNVVNAVQAYQAQFQSYAQNYGTIPGDDAGAVTRFPNAPGVANGDGSGILNAGQAFDSVTDTDETRLVWADLRAAGLVKNQANNTDYTTQPANPFGGIYGFQNGAFANVFTTTVFCMNDVPALAAQAIDARLDDGTSNSGNIQAMASTGTVGEAVKGAVAANYGTAQTYTMCIRL